MKKYVIHGKELWLGYHQMHGYVIFDPAKNQGASSNVTLFVVSKPGDTLYSKRGVREHLVSPPEGERSTWWPMIAAYAKQKGLDKPSEVTVPSADAKACFRCQAKLTPKTHSRCPKCHWLQCSCGACGCTYTGAT